MTAHTPPTPPAARERKLEAAVFVASTTSVLTSSAEGIEGVEDEEGEDEDDIVAKKIDYQRGREKRERKKKSGMEEREAEDQEWTEAFLQSRVT